jgi:dipeptidyl aminopeptidase/acylaminoacyl peptidase
VYNRVEDFSMIRRAARRLVPVAALVGAAALAASCAKRESDLIPLRVLFDNPVASYPMISPDGRLMAYLAPRDAALNIYVRDVGDGGDRPLTRAVERGIKSFHWTKDGRRILYVMDRTGMEDFRLYGVDVETGETRDYTPFDSVAVSVIALWNNRPNEALVQMNRNDKTRFDAYRLDLRTGGLVLAARNPGSIMRWFADTSFAVRGAFAMEERGESSLLVRSSESDPWRELRRWTLEEGASSGPVRFTLSGSAMYCVDAIGANAGRLVSVSLEDGSLSVIAEHPDYDVSMAWLDPRSHDVQAVFFAGPRNVVRILDPRVKDDIEALRGIDDGDFNLVSRDTADAVWIVSYSKDDGPVSYYAYDRGSRKGTFLFDDKPALRDYELARMEPVSIAARDGLELPGYLTLPPGSKGSNLPLVILVHAEPWGRYYWGFSAEVQGLANRGYACLQVNHRGSAGFGKNFANAGNREWGGAITGDIVDAARWAIDRRIADPKRIAVFGFGFGGLTALSAIAAEPGLFRCGVVASGVMDLRSWLENPPPYWIPYRSEFFLRIGDPVADADMLARRSPINEADRIAAPLMLVHGALDRTNPPEQAERIAASLRERGVPHEYLLFPDEGHGIAKPKNRLAFYAAAERFLAKHLGGRFEETNDR